jgi:two-component sensor histidine kinase
VLYGGDPDLVRTLTSIGVTKTVPHLASFSQALAKLATRPARVRRRANLPPQMDSIRRARNVLRDACSDWALPASSAENAGLVLTELVANVVDHAATACDVVVEYDGKRLWLSVSDHSRGVPQVRLGDPRAQRGRGLQLVATLSDQWGVEHLRHAKTIWAVLAANA